MINVPSVVSITSLGPASGSGSGFGCSAGAVVVSVVFAVSAGCRAAGLELRAVLPTLRGGALRARGERAGVAGFALSAVSVGFSTVDGDSAGFACGLGSGVGVAATSVTGGS